MRRLPGIATRHQGDDWNHWWALRFDGYETLPIEGRNAIELGCGPFTNLRIILQDRYFKHVVCSDPLAKEYIQFKGEWLAEASRSGRVLIDDHPLEDCPYASDYFDLVVVINVLDHVRDGILSLRQAVRITKSGGYLVLGQDLTNSDDVASVGEDVGHPIRIEHETLDRSLMPSFEPIIRRILSREEGRNPSAHYGTYLFIGRKGKSSEQPNYS